MWSKTKKALMDRMADSLKKRVRYNYVAFLCDDGTFDFSFFTIPLDLERYQPREEDWTNGSADTLLLCARDICCGSGYLSTYLDMFRRYQQSSGKDMD